MLAALSAAAQPLAPRNGVWIPGGREALAYVARSREGSSPQRFLVDYCRAIVENTRSKDRRAAVYTDQIREHFRRLAALEALGRRDGHRVTLTVSAQSRESGKILHLLGWKLRAPQSRATLEADEKTALGRRLESAIALAVDGVAMQKALEAGKTFSFDLVSAWTPVLLPEQAWRDSFYARESPSGGLAEALARDPRLAQLYVGLSALDEPTRAALVSSVPLQELAERYGPLLHQYSSALALENGARSSVPSAAAEERAGKVRVPGGEEAEPLWEKLVGAGPSRPASFLRALLARDEGRMLAFFFTLSQLDAPHQRFCATSAARLRRFYEVFLEAPELKGNPADQTHYSAWIELLRGAPLDPAGRLRLPGGPRVWMPDPGRAGMPEANPGGAVSAEVEDEILVRLARSRHAVYETGRSELDNLLAVTRLEAHRKEPLAPGAARLLAQNLAEQGAFPYFATLTGLSQDDFQRFFALRDRLRGRSALELNVTLGQLHALLELLCLAQQSGALDEKRAAALFALLCQRFAAAESAAEHAGASLDLLRMLIPAGSANPDEAARHLLLGRAAGLRFQWNGAERRIEAGKIRELRFQRVLEAQKVPSLASLFRIYDAARGLAAGNGDAAENLRALEGAVNSLPSLQLPQSLQVPKSVKWHQQRKNLEAFQSKEAGRIVARLRQRLGNRQEVEALARELLAEINPQVTLALAGLVYACFLNPDDLLVSEDPLLLRKHEFVPLRGRLVLFPPANLYSTSEQGGSYFTGGFADFSTAAGILAASGAKGTESGGSAAVFAAQMAAVRASGRSPLEDDDLRLLGLKIRVAREWVMRAAGDGAARSGLAEAAVGLLSPSRRAQLLSGIAAQDWDAAWQAVSLSDLYFLGDAWLRRYPADPWTSPVTQALRPLAARNHGARLQALGPPTRELRDCPHSHLLPLAPYEEFERYMQPVKMAERMAELNLYLADYMDRAGIPAAAFGLLAEPVAEIVLRRLRMTDLADWRSALAAFQEMGEEIVEEALARL